MGNLVYFSVADRQMESFLDNNAFDRSLVLNVLFQSGIVVPDIFFAISSGLEAHLANPHLTLLETCIEEGLLVPSFRDQSASSFTAAIDLIRNQGIQGVRATAERSMERLQRSAERNKSFRPILPGTDLGTTFDARLGVLQKGIPVVGPSFGFNMSQGVVQKYWTLTERWRLDAINTARDVCAKQFGPSAGIRRGEIMNAVARELSGDLHTKVDDVRTLFARYPDKPELRVFFQWICEIYGYNQAIALGSVPNLPAFNPLTTLCLGDENPEPPPLLDYASLPRISETVVIPPFHVLARISPKELLGVRKDRGAQYLADLDSWQCDPNNSLKERFVRKSLRAYARDLVKWSKSETRTTTSVLLTHLPSNWRWWARTAGAWAVKEIAGINPAAAVALGVFMGVADGGYAIYQGMYQKAESVPLSLLGTPASEVNLLEQGPVTTLRV